MKYILLLFLLSGCRSFHAINCKFGVDPFKPMEEQIAPEVQKDWLCK